MGQKSRIRLVHTSDLHLGEVSGHPYAARALTAVVDAVPRLGGDLLILAGDNFDHARVPDEVIREFLSELGRLDAPVVVLPGNHDLHGEGSVYAREVGLEKPSNVFIIDDPDGQLVSFPELSVDLWGRAMLSHSPEFSPLLGIPGKSEGRWLVATAHGHFCDADNWGQRSSPIFATEIASASCDYLALGHWDRHADVSQNGVPAVYSGTARGMNPPHYLGEVTLVDLDPEDGVRYRQVSLPV